MVNNSGFNGAEALPHELELGEWQKVIDVNLTSKSSLLSVAIVPGAIELTRIPLSA